MKRLLRFTLTLLIFLTLISSEDIKPIQAQKIKMISEQVNDVTLPLFTSISTGGNHACAITAARTLKCWGWNGTEDFTYGTYNYSYVPVGVTDLSNEVAAVTAGGYNTCALTTNGAVKCWGQNISGQLGDGTIAERLTPVDVVGLSSGVGAITAGNRHTCALTTDGAVKCWGDNGNSELGQWWGSDNLTPVDVTNLSSGVTSIAAGFDHTCVIITGGAVQCWGYNGYGQLGDGTTNNSGIPVNVTNLSNGVAAITAGYRHTCALTINGAVKCWGYNGHGGLGDGTTTPHLTPVAVTNLSSGVAAISAAGDYTCALTTNGAVKCWGVNGLGELGDGTNVNRYTPVNVFGLSSGVIAITAGMSTTCALTSSGAVKCWGDNSVGNLGDGTTIDSNKPVDVICQNECIIPSSVTDIEVTPGKNPGSAVLTWNAPGNDGISGGNAKAYDIRYSNDPITYTNWDSAIQVNGEPEPGDPGSAQQMTIPDLDLGKRWYFGLKTASTTDGLSGLSNIPSLQDSGNRPNPSGYSFPNFGASSEDFTIEDMRKMFGDDAVCQTVVNGLCDPKPDAQTWREQILEYMGGGLCTGFAATNLRFFKAWDNVKDFEVSANTVYDLQKLSKIRRQIAYYWALQLTDSVQSAINEEKSKSPDQVLTQLQIAMTDPISNPTTLDMHKCDPTRSHCDFSDASIKNVGHTVTPYAIEETGNGIWKIWVYDSYAPNNFTRYVEINSAEKTWSYSNLGWSGSAETNSLYGIPILAYKEQALGECSWCKTDPAANLEVWLAGNISTVITNGSGQRIGEDNTQSFDEIPGAYALILPVGLNIPQDPVYYLPPASPYRFTITGSSTQTMGAQATNPATTNTVTQFGPGYTVQVENTTPQDQFSITENGAQVTYQSASSKNVGLILIADNDAESDQVQVKDLPVGEGQSIILQSNQSDNQFILVNSQPMSGTYTLEISQVNDLGRTTFFNPEVDLSANDTQYIDLESLSPNGVTVQVDHNSDGSIDKTINYPNKYYYLYFPFVR